MKNNKPKLLAVVGPTASGKTALSIALAKKLRGEIISADSMQIYKGMSIATAKPDKEEMQGIKHHIMDFLEPEETFSVSEYVKAANQAAENITSRGKLPILCGGTGLYVRSFLDNVQFSEEKHDPVLRRELNERYKNEGGEKLIRELSAYDPETASKLHPSNNKRIIRAIEIYTLTGITMSEAVRRSKSVPFPYDKTVIGLTFSDRQLLYDRIDMRVDIMLKNGLLDEAAEFYKRDNSITASAAIGYKELLPYLEGKVSLEEAVDKLKMETRRYAKRQLTWFRKDDYIHWIEADKSEDLVGEALRIVKEAWPDLTVPTC